ncbi:formyltetrahydrofolate deformylase [Pseudopedobacter beijingensis]|uniref:Formyltetrahydrofolate deformylase n=1 Tax=Pseudopedobacter beijingensis TaxID=1207056 RepID=A0ABW4IG31_9SPHI
MVIVIQCKDRVGLVAEISGVMAKFGINILTMREFVDTLESMFFARLVIESFDDLPSLEKGLRAVLPVDASVKVNPEPEKKIVVLVTKEYHCLSDILVRNHFKTLGASVEAVIGNYPMLGDLCERFNVPFHYITHEDKEKMDFECEIQEQLAFYQFDYLVLAKYMRIISPEFVASYPNQIINIHHSFLPAFIGASPYKRAFHRGVKLIGATAHFVTNDLDEGPIIVQQTIPVNHTYMVSDMVRAGKEIETSVLAKALHLVFEDRVFVFNNKTIVFE